MLLRNGERLRDHNGHLEVHSSLLSVVLAEQPRSVKLPQ